MSSPLPPLVVLDFETNGAQTPDGKLDLAGQLPVEVCAVRLIDGEITSVFNTLIYYNPDDHPETGWSAALQNGHHSKEDLLRGMSEFTVSNILWDMIIGPENGSPEDFDIPVLVAYNVPFDFTVLDNMFKRSFNMEGSPLGFAGIDVICPLTIARDRITKGGHKLVAICESYGIHIDAAHSAYDDTLALCDLVLKMHEEGDITPYINVVGYKAQYGPPPEGSYPSEATLKPQGPTTIYHSAQGTQHRQTNVGKPFQRLVMGKPAPAAPLEMSGVASGGVEQITEAEEAERQQAIEGMQYDLVMGLRNAILEEKPELAPPPVQPVRKRPAPPAPK